MAKALRLLLAPRGDVEETMGDRLYRVLGLYRSCMGVYRGSIGFYRGDGEEDGSFEFGLRKVPAAR